MRALLGISQVAESLTASTGFGSRNNGKREQRKENDEALLRRRGRFEAARSWMEATVPGNQRCTRLRGIYSSTLDELA